MKKTIIPAAILCTAICVEAHIPAQKVKQPVATSEPPKVEVQVATRAKTPTATAPTAEAKTEKPAIEIRTPKQTQKPKPASKPAPAPAEPPAAKREPQKGDMVYVPGFGLVEHQGPNIVYEANDIYENGNKIGIMG